jgi:hypothetical protein
MADAMVTADSRAAAIESEQTRFSPTGEVLRDIARGGIAGALVGIVVGGLGARLVMRLVAMLHPDAVGAFTENGNRIGYALLVVGLCTAAWWGLRVRGRVSAPQGLVIAARGAVLLAVMLGVLTSLPHVSRALGAPS